MNFDFSKFSNQKLNVETPVLTIKCRSSICRTGVFVFNGACLYEN